MLCGREVWGRMDTCICMAESFYCPPETIKTLLIGYMCYSVMLTLCDPRGGSLPGSPVPGILQARTLEWVAISFSNAWEWKVKVKSLSHVQLFATPWTAAHQAPPSMGFSRQEYWSRLPFPSYIYIHIHIYLLTLGFPSLLGHHDALNSLCHTVGSH